MFFNLLFQVFNLNDFLFFQVSSRHKELRNMLRPIGPIMVNSEERASKHFTLYTDEAVHKKPNKNFHCPRARAKDCVFHQQQNQVRFQRLQPERFQWHVPQPIRHPCHQEGLVRLHCPPCRPCHQGLKDSSHYKNQSYNPSRTLLSRHDFEKMIETFLMDTIYVQRIGNTCQLFKVQSKRTLAPTEKTTFFFTYPG